MKTENEYRAEMRKKTVAELKFTIKDCAEAIAAMPDGENVPRYTLEMETAKKVLRNRRASQARAFRDDAMRSLGLVKVRGALGGTYWE